MENLELQRKRDTLRQALEASRTMKQKLGRIGDKISENTSATEPMSQLPEALRAHQNLSKTSDQFEAILSALDVVNKAEETLSNWPFADFENFLDAFDNLGRIQHFFNSKESSKLIEDTRTRVNSLLREAAGDIKALPAFLEVLATRERVNSTPLLYLLKGIHRLLKSLQSSQSGMECLEKDWISAQNNALTQYKREFIRGSLAKVLKTLPLGQGMLEAPTKEIIAEMLVAFDTEFEELHRAQCQLKVSDSELRVQLQVKVSNILVPAYTSFLKNISAVEDNIKHTDPDEIAKKVGEFYEGKAPDQKENIGEVQETPGPEKCCTNSEGAGPSNRSPN